jgi:uncharacterized protein (TIGR02001 family)
LIRIFKFTGFIMKNILLMGVAAFAFVSPVLADDNIPGNFSTTIGFVSEYSFRGIAQSNEGPAVQGSIDWSHDSGFYAGVWGSNVEFDDASLETDIYAGYSGQVNGFTYDVGGIYYAYPGSDEDDHDYNFVEGALAVGYDFDVAALSASVNYSPDYFAGSGDATYVAGNLDVPLLFLPFDTALNASVGHQWIDDNAAFGAEDYMDWGIGLSSNVEGFDVGVRYIDTDLEETADCADGCEERVIVSISKSLP